MLAKAAVGVAPGSVRLRALEPLAWLQYACPEGAANALRPWLDSVSTRSDFDAHALEDITELKGLLAVADAVALGRSGQRSEAKAALTAARTTYASERVHQQATLWLADLLLSAGNDPAWPEIERDLARIAEVPGPGWMAKNVLTNHWRGTLGAQKALANIHDKLEDSPQLQDSLELVTIRIRLLLDLDRDPDAALVVTGLDREAGAQLLDPRARIEFLRVAAEAWKREARDDPDPDNQRRSQIYAAAYSEAAQ